MSNVADPNEDLNPNAWTGNVPTSGGASGSTGLPPGYVPPPRYSPGYRLPREFESGAPRPAPVSVPGVVGPGNQIQQYYVPNREAATILGGLDDVTRQYVQNILYRKGWYGSRKPGNGFSDSDRETFADLLLYANIQGQTWDTILGELSNAPDMASLRGGGTRVIRPSSEDLTEILQKTALSTIGKKLEDNEVNVLVKTYQDAYVRQGREQVASADVFFQNRIQEQYGGESDAYKYLNAISNVQQVLGSL